MDDAEILEMLKPLRFGVANGANIFLGSSEVESI